MRLLLLLLLAWFGLDAQSPATLHLDRPFHAAGEVARFQAYLPVTGRGKVRTEIYGPDGRLLDYFFLPTAAGVAEGYHRWPFNLPTGYYRIRFAMLSAEGETVDLGTFRHAVYSLANRSAEAAGGGQSPYGVPVDAALNYTFTEGGLRLTGLSGTHYSVALYNEEVATGASPLRSATVTPPRAQLLDTLFFPGRVTDSAADRPVTVNLLPFFDNTTLDTYFSKSDAEGEFTLTLPGFTGEKTVQARSITEEDIQATVAFPTLEALTAAPPLTEEVLRYLDLSNRRRKIYQLYGTVETPLETNATPQAARPLEASKRYAVQDYKPFPDMLTFFNEVAGELRYRQRRGQLEARLYNAPTQRFFTESPLFIVDGKLTRDVDYVARLPTTEVASLGYFYGNRELRRDFPALGSQGVVKIDLLRPRGDLPERDARNVLPIQGLLPSIADARTGEDVPRLSPLLLWRTGTLTDGTLSLELPVTDDPGRYRIVVVTHGEGTTPAAAASATLSLPLSR